MFCKKGGNEKETFQHYDALKFSSAIKPERKKVSKEQEEAEQQRRFQRKQKKRKEKHKGH